MLSRARARWRWTFRLAIAIPLALIAAAVVLTHSPLTRMLILPRVAAASGLLVEADSVHIRRDGTVVLDRAEFTIPGVPGEAGRFLRIARVEAMVDWGKTLRGEPTLGRVVMTDPVLIVSQSTEDGSLNVGSVPVKSSSGGMALPGITATNVGLELGEHGHGKYRALKRIQMDGSLTPTPDAAGAYAVTLYETMRKGGRGVAPGAGFRLGGTVSDGRIDLTMLNFSLTDWPPSSLPESIREISANLGLTGEVASARFTYTREEGITAGMDLKDVAMNLPVEASVQGPEFVVGDAPPPPRYLRMRGVGGSIVFARDSVVAKVGGLIEDLPYEVTLRYDGVDADSPFHLDFVSKDFLVSRNPELLLYAPATVKYYLKTFLMPTGLLTSHVNITRGQPVLNESGQRQEGPITVSGSIDFREGTAAYETFPYEFNDMTGRFEFDNNEIRILSVTGRSKTGAKLQAHGHIGPLDESSEVDIHVAVTDAQIDEAMEAAFGPGRGAVIKALFNDERHQQLVDAGLIRTPEQGAAEAAELSALEALTGDEARRAGPRIAELKRREQIPVFEFRGRADVSVHVNSPRGVNVPYTTNVDVLLPRAGLVPEKFPYPMIAENVAVEVRNQEGRLAFGTFRGVYGARADVKAEFRVPGKSDPDTEASPDVRIHAYDIPMDDLLIQALPGSSGGFKKLLTDLRVSGEVSGDIHIGARDTVDAQGKPELGFDASLTIESAEVRPKCEGEGVAVAGVSGNFEVNEKVLFLDLEGVPVRTGPDRWLKGETMGPAAPLLGVMSGVDAGERIAGTLTMHVRGEFPQSPGGVGGDTGEHAGGGASFFVAGTCPSFDSSAPFETLVGLLAPAAKERMDQVRRDYHPAGFVDVRAEAEINPGDEPARVRINLSRGRSLVADVMGKRVNIPEAAGSVTLALGGESSLQFDSMAGIVLLGGAGPDGALDRAGTVLVDGELPLGPRSGRTAGPPLEIALLDGRFDSVLTRTVLEQLEGSEANASRANAGAIAVFERLSPSGTFDANLAVTSNPSGDGLRLAHGRIEPRTLSMRPVDLAGNRTSVGFTKVDGSIEFEPGGGMLREILLETPEWSISTDGAWTIGPDSEGRDSVRFQSTVAARGNMLTDDVRAILPEELQKLFDDLKVGISGPFNVTDATLEVDRPIDAAQGAPVGTDTRFTGRLNFVGASVEAGIPISDMNGALLLHFASGRAGGSGARSPQFDLNLRADRFEISGITLSDGIASIRSTSVPGQVKVSEAHGSCHGGRFHARADITPVAGPDSPKRFNAEFQLSGVRFSTLLRELVESVKPFVGPPSPADGDAPPPGASVRKGDEFARGLLDAEFTLTGLAADPASRRGRGTLRISGGRVLNLPIMTGMIEAMNLQLPLNAKLDFAWASFFVEGSLITFEELAMLSSAIELSGGGTMTWPGRELDLRLQSRSTRPIPILSAIIQGIRHQLAEISITGKLGEQQFGLQSPGPSRMIDGVLGRDESARSGSGGAAGGVPERARDRSGRRGIRPAAPSPEPAPGR